MSSVELVAGIDIGGTNMRVALASVRQPARLLVHKSGPMPEEPSVNASIEQISDFLSACCAELGVDRKTLLAVASTVPGIIDAEKGTTLLVTNLPQWDHYPFADALESALDITACIENDVKAAALAEYFYGAGAGTRSLAYMTVSTGVAAGFVIDGKIVRGYMHAAGELGFFVPEPRHLDADWVPNGCLEMTAGGVGLAQHWAAHSNNPDVTAIDVFTAARTGDTYANWLVTRASNYLAQTVIGIAAVLNPEVIVLGGSIAQNETVVRNRIREAVSHALPYAPRIVGASFEGNAPIIGALAIAARSLEA